MKRLPQETKKLTEWFQENQRALPWRANKDPYKIWISEVMLQQTTVAAVTPYFHRFLKRFPNLKSLAESPIEDVLEMWSGLGYYSRAKNIHKAAKVIAAIGQFPSTAAELLELPGFGPYTSRAVSSLAFSEKVGVLDGNVIRVLSRKWGLQLQWWTTSGRNQLQNISDQMALLEDPADVNQGLMELGATVCKPQNPSCSACPWKSTCIANDLGQTDLLPLSKPKKSSEYWMWQPEIFLKKNKVALIENTYAPFLKGQWLFPGQAKRVSKKPKKYDLRHGITHHDIYIQVSRSSESLKSARWVELDQIKKVNPTSLVTKVLDHIRSADSV